jgi:hypothetical protein
MIQKSLQGLWVLTPISERLGELQQSMTQYPNIQPGQEFNGY